MPPETSGLDELVAEAQRLSTICNACRYCEGHCAVFPAVERRQRVTLNDADFLSQLCHQCGACFANCQYAPPHEFAVNMPVALAELRASGYRRFARPALLAVGFELRWVTVLMLVAFATLLFAALAGWRAGFDVLLTEPASGFYEVLPHGLLIQVFGLAAVAVLLSWAWSIGSYWRQMGLPMPWRISASVWLQALVNAFTLKNLDGGHGEGCYETGEMPNRWRRRWHHLVLTGFVLCFAATLSGTVNHYVLDLPAPYDWLSLPKLLGMPGGLLLLAACTGLLIHRRNIEPAIVTSEQHMGQSLLLLLLLTSLTGLALPLLKSSAWQPLLLCLHLGVVLVLFFNFAAGKFVHGFYRLIALVQDQLEIVASDSLGSNP